MSLLELLQAAAAVAMVLASVALASAAWAVWRAAADLRDDVDSRARYMAGRVDRQRDLDDGLGEFLAGRGGGHPTGEQPDDVDGDE